MSLLDRLSVGAKLSLAFFLVLLITAMLGLVAMLQLGRVNDTATELAEQWLPVIKGSQQLTQSATRHRVREYRLMIAAPGERDTVLQSLKSSAAALQKQAAELGKVLPNEAARAKFQVANTLWGEYMVMGQAMEDALAKGDQDGAHQLLTVVSVKKFDAVLAAMDELIQLSEDGADAANQLGDRIYQTSLWVMIAMTLMAVVLGAGLGWVITRRITLPLMDAVKLSEAVAAGDLTHQLHARGRDELAQLQRALGAMVTQLRSVVSQVREGVESVSSASAQIATGNQDLSARTEQTASNLEETASSMEELTGAVSQSADTARQANQLAGSAADAALRGGEVVGQVVQRMGQISESSRKIGDIIGVIDGIAFQTNILALNAAVEAARAGEQGRGFAVVASEVRSLAQRSAEAAKEVKTLINRSVETVEAGAGDVSQAGQAMDEIVSGVRRVTDLMGEIAAAATEQRDGIGQVNQAVAQLDQMTQQNAALVEESSAASASLREQAQRLADVVSVFKLR